MFNPLIYLIQKPYAAAQVFFCEYPISFNKKFFPLIIMADSMSHIMEIMEIMEMEIIE